MRMTFHMCLFALIMLFTSWNINFVTCKGKGCDSGPCLNGGTCTESAKGDDWECSCPIDFTDLQCATFLTTTIPTTEQTTQPTTEQTTQPTTEQTTQPTTEQTTQPTTEQTTQPTTEQTTTMDPTTCLVLICENGGTCIREQDTAVEQCLCPYPTGGIACQLNPKPYHVASFTKIAAHQKVPTPDWTLLTRSVLDCSKRAVLLGATAFNFHTETVDSRHTCEVIIDSGNLKVPFLNWNYYEIR